MHVPSDAASLLVLGFGLVVIGWMFRLCEVLSREHDARNFRETPLRSAIISGAIALGTVFVIGSATMIWWGNIR